MNLNFDNKAKILVIGDSGVGKSSLVHLICNQDEKYSMKRSTWTIGCSVDVKLHEYKDGTVNHKTYFIELWDIGGSTSCRKIFYSGVDGIILTHDLTNRRSCDNLKKWYDEVSDDKFSSVTVTHPLSNESYSHNLFDLPPAIVIGTKLDEAQQVRDLSSLRKSSSIALDLRLDEINLDCMTTKYLSPGSSNSIKLAKFFDKVVEYKLKQTIKEVTSRKQVKSNDVNNKLLHSVYHVE